MSYNDFIEFIQRTDVKFNFETVVKCCTTIIEIDFDSIEQKDYQLIKDFFTTASSLKLIPKEYNKQIDELLEKF